VRKGEVDGRIDPNYVYLSKILKEKFQRSNYDFVNLGKCLDYIQYGISSLANTDEKGVPIIRMGNLKGEEWDFSNLKHIEVSEKDLETYKVLNGDLLFNRTNSKELVGKCAVFREEGDWVFASYLIRVRVNENLLLPDFASFFLGSSIGRMQIDCLSRQIIGMTNINAEEIKLIKIAVPPLSIQTQIVEKFENAYNAKRAKEAEAKELLAGIDAYLLDKLGIATPTKTAAKKTFYTTASKVTGGRLDPFYHHEDYALIERALHKSSYSIVYLSSICNKITDGTHYTPTYQETGVVFLSVKNVRCERFETDDVKYISQKEHEALTKRCKPELNDILLTKIGTVGLAAIVDDSLPEFSIFVSLALLKPKQDLVNPYYLSTYMNSSLAKFQSQRAVKGVGVPDWHLENIRRTEIALPPLEIQNEIAAHIQSVREKAKRLETEAKAEIDRAKMEVERMILGEEISK
jgi:type I restriction enzyme, S subunit